MTTWHVSVATRVGGFELDLAMDGDTTPVALIGPNGSGKTTALRAIAGAIDVENAHIQVGERELEHTEAGIHVPMEHRRIGYVPQGYGLFPHLTVQENVEFGLAYGPYHHSSTDRRAHASKLLSELGCASLSARRIDRLSGGEKQRVALARALVLDPDLLLMDEPLAALDATRRRAVRRFLADRLEAFGRPSILVTHDVRDVIALEATVVALDSGRVIQRGSLDELRRSPANDFIAEFVGAA